MRKRLLAVLLPPTLVAAAVVTVELVLQAGGWEERTPRRAFVFEERLGTKTRRGDLRFHVDRVYTLAPDYRLSPEHAGRYATSSWPFRGRPARPAPEELFQIAVFGDSCVYGEGVDAKRMAS